MNSSHDRVALERFLRMDIGLDDVRGEINDQWSFERDGTNYYLKHGVLSIEPVSVASSHVVHAIDKLLNGQVAEDALVDWANLILMFDAYSLEDDQIRDVLHELATPDVHGPLTPEKLRELRIRACVQAQEEPGNDQAR
jgi:hypothetical protein